MACCDADDGLGEAAERLRQGQLEEARAGYIAAAELHAAGGEYRRAAGILRDFLDLVPHDIPALLKLVQITVHGGLQSSGLEARGMLADAYLAGGLAAEGLREADALLALEPWVPSHLARFRRALLMLRVPHPHLVIAERVAGAGPCAGTHTPEEPGARDVRSGDAGPQAGG